jgi:CHAP domain
MHRTLRHPVLIVATALISLGLFGSTPALADPVDPMTTPIDDVQPPDVFPVEQPDPKAPQQILPPDECSLRSCILQWARYELANTTHNREASGNCNFFSGWWVTSGDATCGTRATGGVKWRANNWCSDFARYVWKQSGANVSGMDPWAGSFYRATKSTTRWQARSTGYVPQPGDAVVFDWDRLGGGTNGWGIDHVGIVESYVNGALTTIEGNTKPSGATTDGIYRRSRALADVIGYVKPV